MIAINEIKKSTSAESIKPLASNNSKLESVTKEIKVYTEEDHFKGKSDDVIELYEIYKEAILNLADDIEVEPKKLYIAFKKDKNLTDIVILKKGLKLFINLQVGHLEDPKGIMRDVSNTGHWENGDYEVIIKNTKELEYIMSLIKQTITS